MILGPLPTLEKERGAACLAVSGAPGSRPGVPGLSVLDAATLRAECAQLPVGAVPRMLSQQTGE